jgi:hypothetical protein
VEPRTLVREDEVALPCSWITAPDYCKKSDESRVEEESFCFSKSVRPGAISLPLDLAEGAGRRKAAADGGGGGRGSGKLGSGNWE